MDAPDLDIKKCVWCGTSNPASSRTCSKCEAVLPSTHPSSAAQAVETAAQSPADESRAVHQNVVAPPVDSFLLDKATPQTMLSLGLGPRFASGQTLAYVVVGLLSIFFLLTLFAVRADFSQIELLSKAPGKTISSPELIGNLAGAVLVRLALVAALLFTAIAFLAWIYRAHQNLKALGALDLQYSPGWAIGGFLVPILNIFRPFQVVAEIWKASGPEAIRSNGTAWKYVETPVFIVLWWGSWLLSGFLNSFGVLGSFGDILGEDETESLLSAARFRIAYDAVTAVCAVLALVVVLKINARQESTNQINSMRALEEVTKPSLAGDQL